MENTKSQKKQHTSKFKFEAVLESFKKDNVNEVARANDINANMISNWRKIFLENGYKIFESAPDKEAKELKNKIAKLERMIGKKEIELNLLKNFSDFYESGNTP
jgi:transposase-like protein